MALYNTAVHVKAAPDQVVQLIKKTIPAEQQLLTIRENMLLVASAPELAYVYLLRPQPDNTTLLRLIVEKTSIVQDAFATLDVKSALTRLTATLEADETIAQAASAHLDQLTRPAIMPVPDAGSSSPTQPTDPFAVQGILTKKPLPQATAAKPGAGPFNPMTIWGYMFFMSSIGSGLVLGYNWRRLGKPNWMWPTMAGAVLMPIVALGAALVLAQRLPKESIAQTLALTLAVGVNIAFISFIAYLQNGAYKQWNSETVPDLTTHKYDFEGALLRALAWIVFAGVIGLVIYFTRPGPQTFQHSQFRVTYPASWTSDDVKQIPDCNAKTQCLAFLHEGRFGYSSLVVIRFFLDQEMSVSEVERQTWPGMEQTYPGVKLESRDTLTLNGRKAARRFCLLPNPKPTGDDKFNYLEQIYLVQGRTVFLINIWSVNKPIFEENRPNIDQIVSSFTLTQGS